MFRFLLLVLGGGWRGGTGPKDYTHYILTLNTHIHTHRHTYKHTHTHTHTEYTSDVPLTVYSNSMGLKVATRYALTLPFSMVTINMLLFMDDHRSLHALKLDPTLRRLNPLHVLTPTSLGSIFMPHSYVRLCVTNGF
jgi:hypothetical protein